MFELSSLLLFSEKPKALVDFYIKVLDHEPDWHDGEWFGFQFEGISLAIGPHDKVKGTSKNPERVMFNFRTEDVQGEFIRIKELGAKVIAEPYEMGEGMLIATFADPDGNYFQLESPWNMEIEEKKPERMVN